MIESIAPTNDSDLFVIPFTIPGMDISNFGYGGYSNRNQENKELDFTKGKISKTLKKLIPSNFTDLHIKGKEIDENSEKIISSMFPKNYIIRSKFEISDKNTIIDEIKENQKKGQTGEDYILYDRLTNEVIKIKEEKDIDSIVSDYIKRYNESKNSEVFKLVRALQLSLKTNSTFVDFGKDGGKDLINKSFEKYLDGNWELIDNNIFLNQGIIVFRNKNYNTVEAVSITANNLNSVYNFGLGTTVLGKFRTNNEANKDPRIQQAKTTEIETLKVLAILNNVPDLFENNTLSDIKVVNYRDIQSDYVNIEESIHNFNQLFKIIDSKTPLNIKNSFELNNSTIKLSDKFESLYQEILSHLTSSNNPRIRDLGKGTREDVKNSELNWLLNIQKKLIKEFPSLVKNPEETKDFSSPQQQLMKLVSDGILYYSNIKLSFDYNSPRYGVRLADVGHLPQTIAFGEGREFDKNGNRVVGLLQGSYFRTTDAMVSDDITQLHDLISLANTKIRDTYSKIQNRITQKTNEYYKLCGRNGLEKVLLGNANPFHEIFFETNQNNKISDQFIYKNPYDLNSKLKDHERDYLKFIL